MLVVAERTAYALYLVSRDTCTYSCSTDYDSLICRTAYHIISHRLYKNRIVYGFKAIATAILYFVTFLSKELPDRFLKLVSAVITSD